MNFTSKALLFLTFTFLTLTLFLTSTASAQDLSANGATVDDGKYTILNHKFGDPDAFQNIWTWRVGEHWGWGSYINKVGRDSINSALGTLGWRWSRPDPDTQLPVIIWNDDQVVTNASWRINDDRNRSLRVGYNMWFHDPVQQIDGLDYRDSPKARIALWLHEEGDMAPAGTLQETVFVSGLPWQLYRYQANDSNDWDVFTFRAPNGSVNHTELKLHEFMHHIVYVKGWMTNDRLLSGVDFGCHVDEARHTLFEVENFYIDVNSDNTPAEPEPQTSRETMYVSGRNLYSPTGEKVVLRGVNEMFTWTPSRQDRARAIREIGKSGANCVRIVWLTSDSAEDLDQILTKCLEHNMIPMPELHDATGNFSKVGELVDYWTRSDVVEVLKKHEKWLLLNIANEAGGIGVPDSTFVDTYKDAITRIRGTGIQAPLVIDATAFGQNYQQLFRNWRGLVNHDPESSLMFSVHTYWSGTIWELEDIYEEIVQEVINNNIPLIFGEGPTPTAFDCDVVSPYQYALRRLQEEEIGWLAWSWGLTKNNDCGSRGGRNQFDITTDGNYGNWNTRYARELMADDPNSLRNTSIRPEGLR